MKRLLFLLPLLLCLPANGQSLWRNFFTTNQNPIVEVVAGSNATVQASTVGSNLRRFTVNSTATGTSSAQTNISWTAVTNLQSAEMPYSVITNAPWLTSTSTVYSSNLSGAITATIIGTIPPSNLATNAASANQVLTATSSGDAKWAAASGGAPLDGTNVWTGSNVFGYITIKSNIAVTPAINLGANGTGLYTVYTLNVNSGSGNLGLYAGSGAGIYTHGTGGDSLVNISMPDAGGMYVGGYNATSPGNGVIVAKSNILSGGNITATNGLVLPSTTATIKWQSIAASNPPTSGAGTAFLFAATNSAGTAEIFTMDGAGVIKQISEHAMDAPEQLIDDNDEAPNISKEILLYTGKVRWINRSRSARQQEMLAKLNLNSLSYYQFTTGKSPTQWTNSNNYGQYTNAIAYLDPLTAAQKQLVIVESFAEYNTRNGLTNGNGLVKASWTADQARFQSDYATSYTNATIQYTNDLAAWTTNSATQAGLVAPVYPSWTPPAVEPKPAWLQKRGVE